MEIKIIANLNYLPKVFLTQDLNKFSLTRKYLSCTRYFNKYGIPKEGCLEIGKEVREVRGIYYVPIPSISYPVPDRKQVKDIRDVTNLLQTDDFKKYLQNMNIKADKLLIRYNTPSIRIYDKFVKGRIYEFPIIAKQGHLTVYQVPPVKDPSGTFYASHPEAIELNIEPFREQNESYIFDHEIKFTNTVLMYRGLYVTPGYAELIYFKNSTMVKLKSHDHEPLEFSVQGNTWLLFSHPFPTKKED